MKPSVYVVILNWNQPNLTLECLKSLEKIRVKNYELRIVVVDNASADNSLEIIQNWVGQYSLKIIQTRLNLGFAGGNNVGIKYALKNNADYICLLNNDTIIDPNIFSEFLKKAYKWPKAGIFSPKIYFAKEFEFHKERYKKSELGKVIWSAGGDIDWKNVYGNNHGVDQIDSEKFNHTKQTDFATGACMFIRKEVFKKCGFLNEKYFLYFEDLEFCVRAAKKSWKILYVPNAKVWHKVSQSSKVGGELNDYYTTRNRLLFGMKYASLRAKLALFRESIRLLFKGRKWQRAGVADYYLQNFYKGSWN